MGPTEALIEQDNFKQNKGRKQGFSPLFSGVRMGRYIYYLNRRINPTILEKLARIIELLDLNHPQIEKEFLFFDFVMASFKVAREERPAVSQLSDILKKHGCQRPGTLAIRYAIQLENLALEHKIKHFIV